MLVRLAALPSTIMMVRGATGRGSRRNHPRTRSRISETVATELPYRAVPTSFRGKLADDGAMLVEVPPEVSAELGPARRPAVRVVVNGVELRTTIAVYGGKSYLGFRKEIREAAGLEPGQEVDITLELDTASRDAEVPDDLARVLAADPDASAAFEALSFTNRKEYVVWVTSAKRPATRQKRLAEAPALLKSGRRTPL